MPGALDSIKGRRTLADEVFAKLRDAIIDGRLEAGQWLRQETLAQELGVSQMPVREALKRLVIEGLAIRMPYRGVRVVAFSPEDIVDIFAFRIALERQVTRFAAATIDAEGLEELKQNLRQAASLKTPEQMAERRRLNAEFHLGICRATGRPFLIRQVEAMWGWFPGVMLYEGMRRQQELSLVRLERESSEHWAILEALEARDARQAQERTYQHIRNLSEELAQVLGLPIDMPAFL